MATVKLEKRDDDDEIEALAAKMAEANKAKLAQQQQQQAQLANGLTPVLIRPGQPGISSFFRATGQPTPAPAPVVPQDDDDTAKGRFGWETVGSIPFPHIFRHGEKYVPVTLFEQKVLEKLKYLLKPDIYSCTCIRSVYVTPNEARLLCDINARHCDFYYFKSQNPFTLNDLLVKVSDAKEFYSFLEVVHKKLTKRSTDPSDRCGFYKINGESVVPYTMKAGVKFVPLFYFEGETDNLKTKSEIISGWDLSYLKFCCKVQGIRNELFANDQYAVVSMADIKEHFPVGTEFVEYWPNEPNISLNGYSNSVLSAAGVWTRMPTTPPEAFTFTEQQKNIPASRVLVSAQNTILTPSAPIRSQPQGKEPARTMQGVQQRPQIVTSNGTPVYMTGWPGMINGGFQGQILHNNVLAAQGGYVNPLLPTLLRNGSIQQPRVSGASMIQANLSAAYPSYARYPGAPMNQPASPRPAQQVPKPPPGLIPVPSGRSPAGSAKTNGTSSPTAHAQIQPAQFRVTKVVVDGKGVPAINRKPSVFSPDLVTFHDLIAPGMVFHGMDVDTCKKAFEAMNVKEIFKPNLEQLIQLKAHGSVIGSSAENVYLIRISYVQQYMSQIKYIISNEQKRKRLKVS
ncbi:uncharacterized protein LOC136039176 isoform X2 [Artemia franciscana]